MPNNQQKEEVKKCKGIFSSGIRCVNPTMTPTSDYCIECYEPVGNDCAQEMPEVTTLEEDRKLIENWPEKTSDRLYDLFRTYGITHKPAHVIDGNVEFIIEKLLAAKERVVRAECGLELNNLVLELAKLLGEDDLGMDGKQWSLDDFKEAITDLKDKAWKYDDLNS